MRCLSALHFTEKSVREKFWYQISQSPTPRTRAHNSKILNPNIRTSSASATTRTPSSKRKLRPMPLEKFSIDLIKNRVVLLEFSGKWSAAQNHFAIIFETKRPRMLLWRHVPSDVVKVMVNCGILVLFWVAYYCLEIPFRRWHKISVVQKHCPR